MPSPLATTVTYGLQHRTTRVWLKADGTHTPDPRRARPFTTHERAARYLKLYAPTFTGAWTVERLPDTEQPT
ncbi:MAG: hypothetical protein A3E78_04005 [Alphaproteobacteria bacterium RIFCSPHIGHO2_12_FULL_63_12]|nr:MAG: hypothetical protein A3E78_04005 [Alphaproteobacteria bacterium RIFCSPHIGHO2_12_FULL_63_12]